MKEIEKRDSVLTPVQQIERLLRPGSTYFNLNPFEVLQVDPESSLDEIKKKYRRLSILVHPDKNMVRETLYFLFNLTTPDPCKLETPKISVSCGKLLFLPKFKTSVSLIFNL